MRIRRQVIKIPKTKIPKIKGQKVKLRKGGNSMTRVVTTDTLFKTTKDITKMNAIERKSYIKTLTKEYMDNAHDLLESLKDK